MTENKVVVDSDFVIEALRQKLSKQDLELAILAARNMSLEIELHAKENAKKTVTSKG